MGNGESKVTGEFEGMEATPDVKAGRRGLLNSIPLPDDCLTLARNLKPTGVLLTPEVQEYEVLRTWQANPLLKHHPSPALIAAIRRLCGSWCTPPEPHGEEQGCPVCVGFQPNTLNTGWLFSLLPTQERAQVTRDDGRHLK